MHEQQKRPAKQNTISDHHVRIERTIDMVRRKPAYPFSVKDLARHAAFSEAHFHRVFKAITGETISGCILRLRLEAAAKTLVYETDKSVTEIALESGFSSSANFAKAFRKVFDCTPTHYRQRHPAGFRISRIGKATAERNVYLDSMSVDVEFVKMPDRNLAGLRLVGSFEHTRINQLYSQLSQWYLQTLGGPLPQETVSITWSDSSLACEETWRMDGCYDVPEGTKGSAPIVMRALNGGWTACLVARVAVTQMTVISDLWDRLVTAALSHPDIELADHPAYEIYRAASDGAAFDITLCLPLIKQPRGVKS